MGCRLALAGQKRLNLVLQDAAARANGSGAALVSGSAAFELYDTYGFPLELTQELAAEQGIEVSFTTDVAQFHCCLLNMPLQARALSHRPPERVHLLVFHL